MGSHQRFRERSGISEGIGIVAGKEFRSSPLDRLTGDRDEERERKDVLLGERGGEGVHGGEVAWVHGRSLRRLVEQAGETGILGEVRIRTVLLIAFLVVPLVEIALLFWVGQMIGFWATLALVILTAFLGSTLVSRQGRETYLQVRLELAEGTVPSRSLAHGAMILVAGALLLTPGFLTDAVGFALLVPQVREALRTWFVRRYRDRWVVIP